MRLALRQGADKTIQAMADCIDVGIQDGSIPNARRIVHLLGIHGQKMCLQKVCE